MRTIRNIFVCMVVIALSLPAASIACTTILVGKNLTADGAVLHGHNEDMGFTAVGRIVPMKGASYGEKDTLAVPYVTIPQPKETYNYWGCGNALGASGLGTVKESRPYDWVLVGMNQWGVTMSCNWMYSKEDSFSGKGIRRYAIRQLILERCKTAREAVDLIAGFIDKYGKADWSGLDYCLADPKEAWVVETTSKNWVAKRIKDKEFIVVANRFVVGDDYDLASKGLIDYAVKMGWYDAKKDGKFSFKKAYGRPDRMNSPYDVDRENRSYEMLEGKQGVMAPEDLFQVLMDRYEGTDKFRKPISEMEHWEDVTDKLLVPRPINTNLCQSSTVAQLRSDLPVEVGSVMWYAMATPGYSGYFPVYAGATIIPDEFQNMNSAYSASSAWWTFRLLQKTADVKYDQLYPQLKAYWSGRHGSVIARTGEIEARIKDLMAAGKKAEAVELLNKLTYSQAKSTLQEARFQLTTLQQQTGNISVW
ncbi:MAG: C69 family dipeptidase [Deltaproteobacteria bacterium]|nr:C69 family dipeptidase [Deltaproteobacteria bacterium]